MQSEEVISRLFLNTKRKVRRDSLIKIANDISWLKNDLGSLQKVADVIGISSGMLNRFLSIEKLSPQIKALVEKRQIDKVSEVNDLSKFNLSEQEQIAQLLITKKLSSKNLKILPVLRKQFPKEDISELAERVTKSDNIKIYSINFYMGDLGKTKENLRSYLNDLIGDKEIISVVFLTNAGNIKITEKGEKILRSKAKQENMTFKQFINKILE
jgi:transcriptional regulator with XRE-family HTH domain